MGGKAFFNKLGIESKRIGGGEYVAFDIVNNIILERYFNRVHTIQAYRHKESFGDCDILVAEPKIELNAEKMEEIKNALKASDVAKNSSIYSYLIDGFQLDLILCNRNHFDSSKFYFDYDPSGNLAGKIAHRFGLRFGHDGLSYILRDKDNTYKLGKIPISSDPERICKFLGFNYEIRRKGFDTQREIFDWVVDSKYFDARIFSYENMNHIARVRDRKRASYKEFLSYIEPYKDKIYNWPLYKEDNLPYIDSYFPEANLIKTIAELKEKRRKISELSEKFNGKLVMEWAPNLAGKELGAALGAYKEGKDWLNFLESNSPEQIKIDFLEFYSKNKA